ncbi:MAG: Ig-like domain-containing protein, partial [Methylophilaceae bacterium]|nr:Ig-like domain-containing protein [Methylophilaceae bacterium]
MTATDGGSLSATQTFTFGVLDKPGISSFTVRDSGATNGANVGKQGESLTFTVLMNEPVNIASGTPSITFSVNNTINIVATYASGSGSNALIFTATAPNGDGNAISLSSIALNGSTITGTITSQQLGNSPTVGQTYSGYTLDNTLPLAPTLSLLSDTGIASNDGITSNATIRVSGLESASGTTWRYQVDATATGSWVVGSGSSFIATSGPHTYFVQQIDVAGNIGPNSTAIYTLLPSAVTPTLRLASDTGVDSSDGITNNATILVGGLAQVASWQYQIDGSGAWLAGGTGTSFTASSGVHTYVARQIDLAGNTSVSSALGRYTLDTAIAKPSLSLASDTGSQASDFITSNATILVAGLEQGAIWDYQVDGASVWIAGGVGSSFLATNGVHSYVVRQTDLAGNSNSSVATIYTEYTAIATPALALASDTGRLSNDNITNNPTILVSGLGTGAAFSWRYQVDGNAWINGAGSSFLATNGQHTYRVQQSDVAGNTSALSTAVTYVLDSLAVVPALRLASDTGKSSSDGITSNATINVLDLESAASWRYQVDGASAWLTGTG